jgi:CubicO group peptidase (beta-lactamase class C family)
VAQSAIVDHYPATEWEQTAPEAAGWSAERLAQAQTWSRQIAPSAAVMIVQHGRVVAEWGDTAVKTNLHSIRKSLLSALIGIAVAENKIDLHATMAALGIDDNEPSLSDEEKKATVLDLLKARSGVYHPALYETAEAVAARPARGSMLQEPSGTITTGTSTHWARFTNARLVALSSIPLNVESLARLGCKSIVRPTVDTLGARTRSIQLMQSI